MMIEGSVGKRLAVTRSRRITVQPRPNCDGQTAVLPRGPSFLFANRHTFDHHHHNTHLSIVCQQLTHSLHRCLDLLWFI